ncbi:hypothetical protein Misp02_37350 [Microtetraspora sp. NBRC 16547]|nr:hypothetical protein Misp02_37350 [Microtetraspora sp. NBRC 16547]
MRVLGLDPYRQRKRLRPLVGIMLQEGGFFNDLTVAETVSLWRGMAKDVGRPVNERILEDVALEEKARTKVRQLSGGQKRRLDLALAVLSRPELLFLDEPTTGMDPEARHATWRVIQRLRAEGTTVLLTTHYLEEAERLADHLAIMHEGRIHSHGTVEEVVAGCGDLISFHLPLTTESALSGPGDRLPFLGGAAPTVSHADGCATVYSLEGGRPAERGHAALRALLAWADEERVTLQRLEVRRAAHPGGVDPGDPGSGDHAHRLPGPGLHRRRRRAAQRGPAVAVGAALAGRPGRLDRRRGTAGPVVVPMGSAPRIVDPLVREDDGGAGATTASAGTGLRLATEPR